MKAKTTLPTLLRVTLIAASLAAASAGAAPAAETAWFVLRRDTGSSCWIAKLARIGGEFARAGAQIAAGPLASEEKAQEALAELARRGVCRRS